MGKPLTRNRRTKIVATLGPSSSSKTIIRELYRAGVDLFRLNFSHGDHQDQKERINIIRKIEDEFSSPIGVMVDLQGPKLRVGKFKNGSIKLKKNMSLRLDLNEDKGDETRVNLPHPEILKAVKKDDLLLMDDGKVRVKITKKGKDYIDTKVIAGTSLSDNKGVNIPGVTLPIAALTDKDRRDLSAALNMGVDWIAQSFVQRPEDVAETKKIISGKASLIAKIEKPSALDHFEEILNISDGIMLARGDLGVEIPPEEVPSVQKHIIRKVRRTGKPIIVATQMLESMIDNPAPTRAEASDVATAVYDGADAVMLSAETAAGNYPKEAVSIMDKICSQTEDDDLYRRIIDAINLEVDEDASDAISTSAYHVAKNIAASCIVNFTTSGSTALRTARQRPSVPILCLTQNNNVARRLTLSYGVIPVHVKDIDDTTAAVKKASEIAKEMSISKKGDRLVLTAGVPFNTPGSTNLLRVSWIN